MHYHVTQFKPEGGQPYDPPPPPKKKNNNFGKQLLTKLEPFLGLVQLSQIFIIIIVKIGDIS